MLAETLKIKSQDADQARYPSCHASVAALDNSSPSQIPAAPDRFTLLTRSPMQPRTLIQASQDDSLRLAHHPNHYPPWSCRPRI
ncbi:hypothetical protein AMECASPLE_028456 [Ameca splendens]|uniref:Uncharacterized protein n=1 Tax=Ameca splendens TaxID=208324 RepID=A0ABV0XIH3_9TELE